MVLWCSVWFPAWRIALQLHKARFSLAIFHSCIVKQLSEVASGRFTQIWREHWSHRHANKSKNGNNWSAFPQSSCWRFRSGELSSRHCCRTGGMREGQSPGHHLLFIPLFLFLFSGWNLDAHSHVLNSRHGGLSYMHMHTLIQLSSGSVKPLVNNCLFSPRRCWVRIRRRR